MNTVAFNLTAEKAVRTLYCPLCNNTGAMPFRIVYSHKPEWEIMECGQCSFTFIPGHYRSDMGTEYDKDESAVQQVRQGNNWVKLQRQKLRLNFLRQFISKGKILDVGAGWGHFLYAAIQEGFAVKGVERDPNVAEYARNDLGLDVQSQDFWDLPETEKFDVITMWDVLEHMDNPDKVVEKCARLTHDDGYLLIQVPQIDSFFARLQRQQWIHLSLDHVNYFSRKTIKMLFEQHGYEVLRIKSSFELKFLLTHSLAHRLKKRKAGNKGVKQTSKFYEDKAAAPADSAALFNRFTNVPQWLLWIFVKAHNILYNLFSALNIGEEMMVIARKKSKG